MRQEIQSREIFSEYREFSVCPGLADHFLCFWTQVIHGPQGEYSHRVLPDACVDIVFIDDNPPFVVGPWTDCFVTQFPVGTKILGARLHPGCAPAVLGLPAAELLNQSVPVESIWGRSRSERFACTLESHNFDTPTLDTRRSNLAELLSRNATRSASPDRLIAAAIQWYARHPGGRVEELSQWLGISARQLQRRFSNCVGYGPKVFQAVLRFQRLLHCAGRKIPRPTLADLAVHAGYSDQAHMTREVQRFAGCTPAALLPSAESTLRMSDLFKTGDSSST